MRGRASRFMLEVARLKGDSERRGGAARAKLWGNVHTCGRLVAAMRTVERLESKPSSLRRSTERERRVASCMLEPSREVARASICAEGWRGWKLEGRGPRAEGRGSRTEGREPRVEGRGSRVEHTPRRGR